MDYRGLSRWFFTEYSVDTPGTRNAFCRKDLLGAG